MFEQVKDICLHYKSFYNATRFIISHPVLELFPHQSISADVTCLVVFPFFFSSCLLSRFSGGFFQSNLLFINFKGIHNWLHPLSILAVPDHPSSGNLLCLHLRYFHLVSHPSSTLAAQGLTCTARPSKGAMPLFTTNTMLT